MADANAHCAQCEAPLRALQLIRRGRHQTSVAHAEQMPKCNSVAVRVHASGAIRDIECEHHSDALRCERLR